MTLLALPPVPMLLLITAGACLLRRRPRFSRTLILIGVLALWLSTTEGMAQWWSRHLLNVPPALSEAQIQTLRAQQSSGHDVAVLVLGGGAVADVPEYGRAELKQHTLERLRYGAWLSRQLGAPLGFTGGIGWNQDHIDMSEAELAQRTTLEDYGINLRWAENQSRDTRQNAAYTLPLLLESHVGTLVLVTHGFHMPRSVRAFEHEANGRLHILAAPMGLRSDAMSTWKDWAPSASGFERCRYAIYEQLGLLAGH
ncbi:YdcF family protein [Burkholderiaceae bacterium UC74_6]